MNLDLANDRTLYPYALDVRKFIILKEITAEDGLSSNKRVLYAFEELEAN